MSERDEDLDRIAEQRDDLDAQVREQVARDRRDRAERHNGPRRPFRT